MRKNTQVLYCDITGKEVVSFDKTIKIQIIENGKVENPLEISTECAKKIKDFIETLKPKKEQVKGS